VSSANGRLKKILQTAWRPWGNPPPFFQTRLKSKSEIEQRAKKEKAVSLSMGMRLFLFSIRKWWPDFGAGFRCSAKAGKSAGLVLQANSLYTDRSILACSF